MQTQITRLVSWYAWIMIAENNNRILVIDGNATTRGRIREILQKAGLWRVDEAPTARDALQLLKFPVPPLPMAFIRPQVLPDWDEFVVNRCLAKQPADRPQFMDEVLFSMDALRSIPF